MWDDPNLVTKNPELKQANAYEQMHRQRQQRGGSGGVLALLGGMHQLIGQVMTAIPLIGIVVVFCLKFIPGVYVVYSLSFTGAAVTAICFGIANALRQGQSLFSMGLGWGTLDVLFYFFGIVFAVATIYGVTVVFIRKMILVNKIVALFFVYNLAVWWNHGFQWEAAPVGAYFFCFVITLFVEAGSAIWQRIREQRAMR
jgi:hypothetical protein